MKGLETYVDEESGKVLTREYDLPQHEADILIALQEASVNYVEPIDINVSLEQAYLAMLPPHLGKPYLTDDLVLQIGLLKLVITDNNHLGLSALSKALLQNVALPSEMEADRETLLDLYPKP